MDQNSHVNSLLDDGWFFGNSLANKPRPASKMVRCYSDPCPCSSTKEQILVTPQNQTNSKMNNLLQTSSLPPFWGREMKYSQEEEGEEEEDEPRMGDLIRQAMPLPMPSGRILDRTPSLPPCRGKEVSSGVPGIQNGPNGSGTLTRRATIASSVLLPEKCPYGMPRLSRKASTDSSMVLPPKYTSKATQTNSSNSKNQPQRKLDLPNVHGPTKDETRNQNLNKNKSQKSLSDLEIEELEGFKGLGFSFNHEEVHQSVAQILPALQRRGSIGSGSNDNYGKVRRPYLSKVWQSQSSSPLSAPPIIKRADPKAPSAEDMKAQIKFWARAVASNVRQEC
ncbi:hypothetical protein Cgig2_002044 [Carnegiea gigantea]|uniref:Uncharacterized protein n=1 Tax=Carnegiea gigantea TaxID=171969 RepID=A0A9Q1K5L0_9CARY|nr:hypothetical protein Cgig2_002044 [Carnegiea gigantea]